MESDGASGSNFTVVTKRDDTKPEVEQVVRYNELIYQRLGRSKA